VNFLNICILGSTGRVGSKILSNSINAGHTVHALVRDITKAPQPVPNLKVIIGDVLDSSILNKVIANTEVIICALSTEGDALLSSSIPLIIKAMEKNGIKRIITIGTAGILQARSEPNFYRFQSKESRRKSTKDAEDHLSVYEHLKISELEWTIVCPTYLPDGERTGIYRSERDILPDNGTSISTYDTADFAFGLLFSKQYLNCRVGLAY
jgi:uncharacterized protein